MRFARLINGVVVEVLGRLPNVFKTDTGETILGFSLLSLEDLEAFNLYPIVEAEPYDTLLLDEVSRSFTVSDTTVTEVVTTAPKNILTLKRQKIAEAYALCQRALDEGSVGYSPVEISKFPFLQSDVEIYNQTQAVGPYMQKVLDRGRHTAESLAILITSKTAAENAATQTREDHVIAISALENPQDVIDYEV